MSQSLARRLAAEGLGAFFLFATVIGSGIMAEHLSRGNDAVAILGTVRHRPAAVPAAVALYIVAAYWFTSSTSFANPAITVARSLSDTFAGIAPHDVPLFIVAQLVGAALGAALAKVLFDDAPASAVT